MPPLKVLNGKWAINNKEKATVIANHLDSVFQPFPFQDPKYDKKVVKYINITFLNIITIPNFFQKKYRQSY